MRSFHGHVIHLMLSKLSFAVSGILFWYVATRMYSVAEIGLASALTSAASLILFISFFCQTDTFVRFLPQSEKKETVFSTFVLFSLVMLGLICFLSIMKADLFFPDLQKDFTGLWKLYFVAYVLFFFIFQVLEGLLISFKHTDGVLLLTLTQNFLRIGMLVFLSAWGAAGIFWANGFGACAAVFLGGLFFLKKGWPLKWSAEFNPGIFQDLLPFSAVNFLNASSTFLPGTLLPIFVLHLFSKQEAGFFYLPWMMFMIYASFFSTIMSVFVMKTSHGESPDALWKKMVGSASFVVIVGVLVFVLGAVPILAIFKKDFAEYSAATLRILFSSFFFYPVHQIYTTLANVRRETAKVGVVSAVLMTSFIVFCFLFFPAGKIELFAWAWLAANAVTAGFVLFLIFFWKTKK